MMLPVIKTFCARMACDGLSASTALVGEIPIKRCALLSTVWLARKSTRSEAGEDKAGDEGFLRNWHVLYCLGHYHLRRSRRQNRWITAARAAASTWLLLSLRYCPVLRVPGISYRYSTCIHVAVNIEIGNLIGSRRIGVQKGPGAVSTAHRCLLFDLSGCSCSLSSMSFKGMSSRR